MVIFFFVIGFIIQCAILYALGALIYKLFALIHKTKGPILFFLIAIVLLYNYWGGIFITISVLSYWVGYIGFWVLAAVGFIGWIIEGFKS